MKKPNAACLNTPEECPGPEDRAYAGELGEVLECEIARLPHGQRIVFMMRHHQGLKLGEIAEALGLAEGTVKRQLHAAVHRLRGALAHANVTGGASMTSCERARSGDIELYFYGDLNESERGGIEAHILVCAECRQALDDLEVIASALSTRPLVEAPPRGDWTGFMQRLDDAVRLERQAGPARLPEGREVDGQAQVVWRPREVVRHRRAASMASYLAMAALLTLVTASVVYVAHSIEGCAAGEPGKRRAAPRRWFRVNATGAVGGAA